jgi:Tol biopolymer transport system component
MIEFTDFVPSPDGRIIAFEYIDKSLGRNHLGLGLLEWQTGTLTRIPNPLGKQLSEPSFSYDGKQLVVGQGVAGSLFPVQLAVIDIATLSVSELTPESRFPKSYPVFQPGSGNILYVQYQDYLVRVLILFNPLDQSESVVLDRRNGFVAGLSRPSFVKDDEIVFQGSGPADFNMQKLALDLTHNAAAAIAYRMRFGGPPTFLSAEAERHVYLHSIEGAFANLSASREGRTIIFLGRSPDKPTDESGEINRELFTFENAAIAQVTNLHRYMWYARISYDGSVVVFGSDPNRRRVTDLFVYDMRTKEITATGLLDRLRAGPEFALH